MEKRVIDPEKRREVQRLTTQVIVGITALIIIYVVYGLITKRLNGIIFEAMLMLFVLAYVFMNDIVEPYRLGVFKEMTMGQKSGFIKIMALDVVGIAAVVYWIMGIGAEENTSGSILPLVIYIVTVQIKRKFRPEFEGIETEEDQEAVESVQEEQEEKEEEE